MTEDEAKMTICPVMSFSAPNEEGKHTLRTVKCQGSTCAWWSWGSDRNTVEFRKRQDAELAAIRAEQGGKSKAGDYKKAESRALTAISEDRLAAGNRVILKHGRCAPQGGIK